MTTLKGYKAFNKDFTCRGFKFEVGKEYEIEGELELCGNGFHFCINAQDCLDYYENPDCFAEVEAIGKWIIDSNKTVTSKIRIVRSIDRTELLSLVNSGRDNSGFRNSGNRNSGNRNSGYYNSGNYNSGYYNSGNNNSGNNNSGNRNSGNYNSGNNNSGNNNSGNNNSGYYNSGYYNSGNYNSGYYNSGMFNSNEPYMRMFNKETVYKTSKFRHPALDIIRDYWFDKFSVWISSSNMTDVEKEKYPSHKTTGGFLRTNTYKEAWSLMWEQLTQEQKDCFKTLPNFDAEIFEEITGIKI